MKVWSFVIWALACGFTADPPTNAPPPPPWLPDPIVGTEALRVSPSVVEVGMVSEFPRPFRYEFRLPEGETVSGRGLPAFGTERVFADPEDDGSILHLEIPAHRNSEPDEAADIGDFAPAKFCVIGEPCPWSVNDPGRWRAFRIRVDGGFDIRELQLGHPRWDDAFGGGLEITQRIIAVWMDEGEARLDHRDTIIFTYAGPLPYRSTTWLDVPFRPHFRYRADGLVPEQRREILGPPVVDTIFPELEDSDAPADSDVPGDTDPAGETDPFTDTDQPGDTDPSADTDVADDTDPSADTDPAGDTDPSSDTDPAGDTDPPADTDPAGDTDPSADTDPAGDTDPALDTDPAADTDPTVDSDTDPAVDTDPTHSADTDPPADSDTDVLVGTADTADTRSPCPSIEPSCWVNLAPEDIQGLHLTPGRPAFVRTIAPLDVVVGQPVTVRFVVLDAKSNPAPVTGNIQPRANGASLGPTIRLDDQWEIEAVFTPMTPGPIAVRANPSFRADAVYHHTMVHAADEPFEERLLGDLHAHSGGGATTSFQPSALGGDHRGNFTRGYDTLAYMHRVAGLDFGALAEHAVEFDGYTLPDGDFSQFEPGGLCEPRARIFRNGPDWWTESQSIIETFDAEHPDFVGFPAYEWHGTVNRSGYDARLHRVVTFFDHDIGRWPMLHGSTYNRPAQCLFHFLEQSGLTPSEALVIPHMMYAKSGNRDWDLTYNPGAPWDSLVSSDAPDRWQRVGELFSARNFAESQGGRIRLARFEGLGRDPTLEPWTFRYGWRDTAATLGIIGGSDDHLQMAGSDNLFADDGSEDHTHDPGGVATVVSRSPDRRHGIYRGLYDRTTYGTSGPRAWLEYYVEQGGQRHLMGSELDAVSDCSVPGSSFLMVGRAIRNFVVWGAPVSSDRPYTPIAGSLGSNVEREQLDFDLVNPLAADPEGPSRWLYYVRAFVGDPVEPGDSLQLQERHHQDAVWSSPIWIDWRKPEGCSAG